MNARAAKFFLGVAIPTTLCWIVAVLVVAALGAELTLWRAIVAAMLGVPFAIFLAAYCSSADEKSSLRVIGQFPDSEMLRRGLRRGLIVGPISVVGVAIVASMPLILDRILTGLGR